jgi:hypothetical protein
MIFSEVQRTLVKSPPELWAELSDPEALARHLGEFGEIRITRVQPEQKVEWEAASGEVSGTVAIKPSGWGTKVKLTVARELELAEEDDEPGDAPVSALAEVERAEGERAEGETLEGAAEETPAEETSVVEEPAIEGEANLAGSLDDDPELDLADEPLPEPWEDSGSEEEGDGNRRHRLEADLDIEEPEEPAQPISEPEPEPRRGFFARLFRRRRRAPQVAAEDPKAETIEEREAAWLDHEAEAVHDLDEPEDSQALEDEAEIESFAEADPFAETESFARPEAFTDEDPAQPEPRESEPVEDPDPRSPDIAAELEAAEELATEQATAVLTGVLDRLGAAHHRPFSRA